MLRTSIGALVLAVAALTAGAAGAEETASPASNHAATEATATSDPSGAPGAREPTEPALLADPVPDAARPDPLTPANVDQGPAQAPGMPTRAASPATAAAIDPIVMAVRAHLAARPDVRLAGDKADLQALKDHYDGSDATPMWISPQGLTSRAEAAIAAMKRAATFGLDAEAFELPPTPAPGSAAEAIADAEVRLSLAVLKYVRHARGGRIDPPTISQMIDMRPRLFEPRSVLAAVAAAPAADAYLEGLHPQHAGFNGLREALAKLQADTAQSAKETAKSDTIKRIVVNMERWRWLPDDLGAFHVWDNVPEQVTRVVHDGKVVLQEKIVVGKPSSPTPIFSAPMRFVIFHPSWGVPEGIKTNEIAPMLRRAQARSGGSSLFFFSENNGASRALARHELKVFHGGREVNPDSVNWSSADVRQFTFTQPPSAKNVLGVVKFRFPNRFDVYMHDTSERHLFSRAQRTFSHGCMRVENPLRLAETILAYDKGWSKDKVAALVARDGTTDVTLDKKVPVHIVNFTATVDDSGKLHMHGDIYGIDNRVASALTGRSVTLASAKATTEAETSAPARPAARKEPAKRQAQTQAQTGGNPASAVAPARPFNPFGAIGGN